MKPTCKTFLWLALAVLTGLAACKKDENPETFVSGQVMDVTTNKPVPNSKVYLQSESLDCVTCWPKTISDYTTDGMGNFSFSFMAEKNLSYTAISKHDLYLEDYAKQIGYVGIEIGKKNTEKIIFLQPKAWIKVYIKNVNPINNGDYISLSTLNGGPFYGQDIDTIIIHETFGNKFKDITWLVEKNNIKISYNDSIFCPSFDTTKFYINY